MALRRIDTDDPDMDRRSLGAWLAEQRQGPAAVASLWRLIALPTLNLEPDRASLAQAAQVFQTGLLRARDAGDIGYARAPLSDVHDGPARRALARAGVAVRLRTRAERLDGLPDGRFAVIADGERIEADAVIVATPPERAAGLLPADALPDPAALGRLGRSPIVNLHIHYDRRVLDEPFCAGVGTPVQFVFDRTRESGVPDGQLVGLSISAADEAAQMDEAALRARYLPAMAQLFPAARDAAVRRFVVTREHAATFRAGPGARALRPPARTLLPGLLLAGAWTDTGWPATMEGAVRSGHAAADAAREALESAARERRVAAA
jgi:hydroxysqualene dehydroxylase